MNKKYEFTGEVKVFRGRTLRRIKRIEDDLVGGWIETEDNLSHNGDCFVYDNARIYDDAEICDGAKVYGDAEIYGNARVRDCARVYGSARVHKGEIIGQISQPYKDIFQCRCKNRILTAILTEDNEILYTIGCQNNITKKQFLDRIHNENGGLKENPHREEYLRLIPLIEQYFRS